MTSIVLVFVDGLGLGDPELDPALNPVTGNGLRILANFHPPGWSAPREGGRPRALPPVHRREPLPLDGIALATDASLGVPGLPQSATGQTTLLTGENGAAALGRHYTGFPTKTLQTILLRASIFKRLADLGRRATFLNAFTPRFFDLGERVWGYPMGATSWACRAAGLPFRDFDDLRAGRAVFHDMTHDTIPDLDPRTPEEAGEVLAATARDHDFTLYEFFQTDKAGHARDAVKAGRELEKLERFLATALAALEGTDVSLVVTSDHGNVEDLRKKTHTHNPVPTLVFGPARDRLAGSLDRLEKFTPAFVDAIIDSSSG